MANPESHSNAQSLHSWHSERAAPFWKTSHPLGVMNICSVYVCYCWCSKSFTEILFLYFFLLPPFVVTQFASSVWYKGPETKWYKSSIVPDQMPSGGSTRHNNTAVLPQRQILYSLSLTIGFEKYSCESNQSVKPFKRVSFFIWRLLCKFWALSSLFKIRTCPVSFYCNLRMINSL